ncbi:RHS repeat domain-containing protein [Paraburkholderia phenoliruptrix]|uniref:RHS repeat domain-containing protein n=1 Tax=Paraburkholderia phenoliruptrix TaxID=252970 RepID=UPI001C6E4BD4|nr:hypothetical protein [Paraburkholderia phenoliruptrix]MBW9127892.1 hypothetical protein [Paraburkholderia ginsengiterrae]
MLCHRNWYCQPEAGRFISGDPTGWASGQTNAYAYVNGNPVRFNDPTGEAGLPMNGPANACVLNPSGSGQMRLYDADRRAAVDLDFDHSHGGMTPRAHHWNGKNRDWAVVPFCPL